MSNVDETNRTNKDGELTKPKQKRLQERWNSPKAREKLNRLVATGARPDIVYNEAQNQAKQAVRVAARLAYRRVQGNYAGRLKEGGQKLTLAQEKALKKIKNGSTDTKFDKIVDSDKMSDFDNVLADIFTPEFIRKKLMNSDSPAILQMILNRLYGSGSGGQAITVSPVVFRVVKSEEGLTEAKENDPNI